MLLLLTLELRHPPPPEANLPDAYVAMRFFVVLVIIA